MYQYFMVSFKKNHTEIRGRTKDLQFYRPERHDLTIYIGLNDTVQCSPSNKMTMCGFYLGYIYYLWKLLEKYHDMASVSVIDTVIIVIDTKIRININVISLYFSITFHMER